MSTYRIKHDDRQDARYAMHGSAKLFYIPNLAGLADVQSAQLCSI